MKRRLFLFSSALLLGCAPESETESMCTGAFDGSLSFLEKAESAFYHFSESKDAYFRSVTGIRARMVITQISGNADSILFDGSSRAFSNQFPTGASFKTWLASKVSPDSSRVCLSLAETVEWLCKQHERNRMSSTLMVYSDMDDNHGGQDRLQAALSRYAKFPVSVWLYWVKNAEEWELILRDAGFDPHVEPSFRADPPRPYF